MEREDCTGKPPIVLQNIQAEESQSTIVFDQVNYGRINVDIVYEAKKNTISARHCCRSEEPTPRTTSTSLIYAQVTWHLQLRQPCTTATMPQPLSSKDASSFRQVVRHYENKQYKKGGLGTELSHSKFLERWTGED